MTNLYRLWPTAAPVCPAGHRAPYPSQPTHCPPWCDQRHADQMIWPECCDCVMHSTELGHALGLVVTLCAAETSAGLEPATVSIETERPEVDALTPDQLDTIAATLRRAAVLARHHTTRATEADK